MTRFLIVLGMTFSMFGTLPARPTPAELFQKGRYKEAAAELENRLTTLRSLENPSPDDQLEIANTQLALGMSRLAMGQGRAAISALKKSHQLHTSLSSPPLTRSNVLDALGRAYQLNGDYDQAEETLRQALGWRARIKDSSRNYWLNITRDHLALLLLVRGHYREAGEILQTNLQSTPESDTRLLAQRHHNYARYLLAIRNYHRASEHAEKAVKLARESGKPVSSFLDLLALARHRSGDSVGAEAILFEALEILEVKPPSLQRARGEAEILNKLGEFSLAQDPALAAEFFQRALNTLQAWLKDDHPVNCSYLNNLGLAHMRLGNHGKAADCIDRALTLLDQHTSGIDYTNQRRAEWLQNRAWNTYLAGNLPSLETQVEAACNAAELTLHHLLTGGTEHERLNFLAHFDLYSLPATTRQDHLLAEMLFRNKAKLLDSLISKMEPSPSDDRIHLSSLQEAMRSNEAAVDFLRYRIQSPEGITPVYGAVLHLKGQEPRFIPLADEQTLLRWLSVVNDRLDYRASLIGGKETGPPSLRLQAALRKLHQSFLAPVLNALPPGIDSLAFSPDGSLHFLPFAALLDDKDQFLAQRFQQVVFVNSLRDLTLPSRPNNLSTRPWQLIGFSQFEDPGKNTDNWFGEKLAPLPYVEDEIKTLSRLAPRRSLSKVNPPNSESFLKNLPPAPSVLHLATHAFFQSTELPVGARLDLDAQPEILLRSGIALSNGGEGSDDCLYPYEIADLPLDHTTLVTLSACQTGLGTPLAGEGVLGLRRAFALAGADNTLLTLWRVPDRSTADFMSAFYRRALHSNNLPHSLWSLQGKRLTTDCPNPTDDVTLETAVLRHAPFLLTHRGPTSPIPAASPSTRNHPPRNFWWRYAIWFAILIVLIIWTTTVFGKGVPGNH